MILIISKERELQTARTAVAACKRRYACHGVVDEGGRVQIISKHVEVLGVSQGSVWWTHTAGPRHSLDPATRQADRCSASRQNVIVVHLEPHILVSCIVCLPQFAKLLDNIYSIKFLFRILALVWVTSRELATFLGHSLSRGFPFSTCSAQTSRFP